MAARTLMDQRSDILTIADDGTSQIESVKVKPSISEGFHGTQGALREAIEVSKPVIVWNLLPNIDLVGFEANLTITGRLGRCRFLIRFRIRISRRVRCYGTEPWNYTV